MKHAASQFDLGRNIFYIFVYINFQYIYCQFLKVNFTNFIVFSTFIYTHSNLKKGHLF